MLVQAGTLPQGALILDCRHDLTNPEGGPARFRAGHVPGAQHAHIDRDLSGPVGDGSGGRHPLPDEAAFVERLRNWGLQVGQPVVVYDDAVGQWAARAWWLLRHYGHSNVAILDGGWKAWQAAGGPSEDGSAVARRRGNWTGTSGHMPVALPGTRTLLDARAPERYRGEVEPVDKRPGHIPGAVNVPFASLVTAEGFLLEPDALQARFRSAGALSGRATLASCGSGVTGSLLVLAMEQAGLGTPALYLQSYSGWISRASNRVVLGSEP